MAVSKLLARRRRSKGLLRKADRRGDRYKVVKKKKDRAIDRFDARGDEAGKSNVVKSADLLHSLAVFARDATAAGGGVAEGPLLTATADCVTAMDTGENAVDVEKETSQEIERREKYFSKTALTGRRGRKNGKDIRVDAKTTVAEREYQLELKRATRAGERDRQYEGPTLETHALAVKTITDEQKRRGRNRRLRVARAQKAAGVATPKDCIPAHYLGDGGEPLFITDRDLVPPGSDNKPLIAEKAAARAVRHRAEKEVKTRAEKAADRRAGGLPDNVRPSKAGCRAGQYYIVYYVDKSYSKAIKAKFKKNFSVVKPGTNGYYASTKDAADVRDEWIKKKRPESWMAKERS